MCSCTSRSARPTAHGASLAPGHDAAPLSGVPVRGRAAVTHGGNGGEVRLGRLTAQHHKGGHHALPYRAALCRDELHVGFSFLSGLPLTQTCFGAYTCSSASLAPHDCLLVASKDDVMVSELSQWGKVPYTDSHISSSSLPPDLKLG